MTVSSSLNRKTYTGDAVTTSFATSPVVFFATSDLDVYVVTTATGAATLLTENTHYTVSGGSGSTGTVNLAGGSSPYGAPAATQTLVIVRTLDLVQQVDFVNNEATDAEVAEDALDKLTMMVQQLDAAVDRAFHLADSDVSGASLELPTPVASTILGWSSTGLALQNYSAATLSTALTTPFTLTLLDDTTAAAARTTLDAAQNVHSATAETTLAAGDEFLIYDVSEGAENKVTLANLFLGVNVLTADTLPDRTADYLLSYDASAGAAKKIKIDDFPLAPKHISGLTYSNSAGDATNDIDIAAGMCRDATNAANLLLSSTLTKQLDAAWAVGTNAGGLDTGSIGNSDYYIWLIKRSDTGVVDALFSLSSTAPTVPANYDYKRLIGWFKRVGGTIVAFTTYETEGGGLELNWSVPTLDVNLANTLTTSRRTDAVKVPLNLSTEAHLNVTIGDASAASYSWIYCPDQTDTAPSNVAAPLANLASTTGYEPFIQLKVRTSATGTVAARSTLATCDVYQVSTIGFKWARRV